MRLFLDTSTLFKLYQKEAGTDEIIGIIINNDVSKIFLSEITKIEFDSAVWKNVRSKILEKDKAIKLINLFRSDYSKYHFVDDDKNIKSKAQELISKYNLEGLRTLDSIQMSTAILIPEKVDLCKSSDKKLIKIFELEGLNTKIKKS